MNLLDILKATRKGAESLANSLYNKERNAAKRAVEYNLTRVHELGDEIDSIEWKIRDLNKQTKQLNDIYDL